MRPASSENACNAPRDSIVVLGIGNLLWADEGFGVRCVEALDARYAFASHVRLVDGGTQGLYLLPQVQAATHLLILDAIDYGLAPGSLKLVHDDEVPRFLGARKMSLHQTGFQEVLALAQFTGTYPAQVTLIGCQPQELEDYGGSLRPIVRAALEQAIALAVSRLAAWGAEPTPRALPPAAHEAVSSPQIALATYEAGRPTALAACRVGDARFMPGAGD